MALHLDEPTFETHREMSETQSSGSGRRRGSGAPGRGGAGVSSHMGDKKRTGSKKEPQQPMELQAKWAAGGRTPAWDALWRRILSDVLRKEELAEVSPQEEGHEQA